MRDCMAIFIISFHVITAINKGD